MPRFFFVTVCCLALSFPVFSPPVVPQEVPVSAAMDVAGESQAASSESESAEPELFADWPTPQVVLVFTGFLDGYIEPCGCAGMDQMKGGLSRRYTFLQGLGQKNWPVVAIDAGNLNKGFGRQEELKYNIVIDEAMRHMNYRAVGIGNRELKMPTDDLIPYVVDVPGNPRLYTSANVAVIAFNDDYTKPYRVIEENGLRIAVTSVVGQSFLDEINNAELVHDDPIKKLREILPRLAAEQCDRTVLIVHGNAEEIQQIQNAVGHHFDFFVPSDPPAEPPLRLKTTPNSDTMLVEVGEKGKFAVAIGLFDDEETPIRYERIPLDSRFANSKVVLTMMEFYQDQLAATGFDGLGIKPIADRRAAENGKFVGSEVCANCHASAYRVWQNSKHATAWESLAETAVPARTHDPECVACHVVGWHSSEFLPYENGFRDEKETPKLLQVGCEACHGPGEKHAAAQMSGDKTLQEKLHEAMRLPRADNVANRQCITCHDGDNSPEYDFNTYWPKIIH